ncbi:hypothetical protein ACHQM5_017538 [Ranunculus cassubicifolius]
MESKKSEPCLSESSSIISISDPRSQHRDHRQDEDGEEEGNPSNHSSHSNRSIRLELSLSSKITSDHVSNSELNLLNCFNLKSFQIQKPQENETTSPNNAAAEV